MENAIGLLKIRVKRGINLVIRDTNRRTSDPYVVVTMDQQRLKTRAANGSCNPEWDDELTLCLTDPKHPINLTVYDKDTLTGDDKMGEAAIEIKPYLDWCTKVKHRETSPNENEILWTVQPNRDNCLAEESCILWKNGKIVQDMILRLNGVECGEVEVQLGLVNLPGQ